MLTPAQIEARRGKLTGSRIACLMQADAHKIDQLYREMIGEAEPENLDHVWAVQLGIATEDLNRRWFEMKNSCKLVWVGTVWPHRAFDWAACTLDGYYQELGCPIEFKTVGGREPIEVVIDRYQPQLQWQMECTQADQAGLSMIIGGAEPVVEFIPRDQLYIEEMIRRGAYFMSCVELHQPPVLIEPVPPPIDASKLYNMEGVNEWASWAAAWLETCRSKEINVEAEKNIKYIVPPDAKKCWGHGIRVTRDRAGRLSLRADI